MKRISTSRRIVVILALSTIILTGLDLLTHHHAEVAFLPHFGLYLLISIFAGFIFIVCARLLTPLLCRKGDYYDR